MYENGIDVLNRKLTRIQGTGKFFSFFSVLWRVSPDSNLHKITYTTTLHPEGLGKDTAELNYLLRHKTPMKWPKKKFTSPHGFTWPFYMPTE